MILPGKYSETNNLVKQILSVYFNRYPAILNQYSWVWLILHQPRYIREIEGQTIIVICAQEVAATSALSSSPSHDHRDA